jgi:hypothetical protein
MRAAVADTGRGMARKRRNKLVNRINAIIVLSAFMVSTTCWGQEVKFDEKNFQDNGVGVGISGTMTGNGVPYKNNTYAIWCNKFRKECLVSSIADLGNGVMGRLDYPYALPIVSWKEYEVIAADEPSDLHCLRTVITISRASHTASFVEEWINQGKGSCENKPWIHRWAIE